MSARAVPDPTQTSLLPRVSAVARRTGGRRKGAGSDMSGSSATSRIKSALAASSLLLLAACAGAPQGSTSGTVLGPDAGVPPSVSPTGQPPAVAALPRPEPAPSGPPQEVQRLVGVKGEYLRQWMGDTVFVRHDGIAEIWRFAAESCFLDVFLYRETDGLRVAYLDARPRNGNQRVLPQSCYGLILADRKKQASS